MARSKALGQQPVNHVFDRSACVGASKVDRGARDDQACEYVKSSFRAAPLIVLCLFASCKREQGQSGLPLAGASNVSGPSESGRLAPYAGVVDNDSTRSQRARLVNEIQRKEKLSSAVVHALRTVPRHAFVGPEQLARAYDDIPLPIGEGQTISQPTVVAMMTEALELRGGETVLEIGTGSGYQAAILSRIAKRVESIEIVETLADRSRNTLEKIGYENVRVHVGNGYEGLPHLAPFSHIIITAAPPEVPPKLIEQLAIGGKMVLPVGPRFGVQDLLLLKKNADGFISRINLGPVRFVPLVRDRK